MELFKMYINGEWCESSDGKTREQINPSNGESVGFTAEGTVEDVNRAVDAAAEAFASWRLTSTAERAELLRKAADIVDERAEIIAKAECACSGQLYRNCQMDAGTVSAMFRFYAGLVDLPAGMSYNQSPMVTTMTLREPIGVVGVITPWNAPIDILSKAIAPALAAGNTVVVKPSSITPLGTLEVIKCMEDAGFPKGVVNLVLGEGSALGEALGSNMKVGKISFTGGTETGRSLIHASASNIKKLSMELGGKSAVILFDDADVDAAVDNIMYIMYSMAGELCVSCSRALVQDTIYDQVVEKLASRVAKIRVGQSDDPEAEMGPMISKAQVERVMRYIEIGKQEGARLVTGGYRLTEGDFAKGNFVAPTVFADVTNDMRIAQEEIFGPVLVVEKFSTEEEAFAIANDSVYGLGAGCYTKDLGRSMRFAKEVKAACMWVNTYGPSASMACPICCTKQSGYSTLMGVACLESYMDMKQVNFMGEPFEFGWFQG